MDELPVHLIKNLMKTLPLMSLEEETTMNGNVLFRDRRIKERLVRPARVFSNFSHRQSRFLKGPIPMAWIDRAARLPGRALHVALIIWHRAAMQRKELIHLSASVYHSHGIPLATAKRALRALEQAKLVVVQHQRGKAPRVRLIREVVDHPVTSEDTQAPKGENRERDCGKTGLR